MTYNGQTAEYYWNYDFYYKDHLGNIRATVTEQQDQSRYTVTTEAAVQTQELSYTHFNPADTRTRSQIPGYANTAENNNRVIRTLTNGQRYMAYNTVLKVMAGDEVDIKVDYYYRNSETASDLGAPPQDWNYWGWVGLLYPMFGNMAGAINPAHLNSNQISGSGNSVNAWSIGNFLSNRDATTNSSRPKAYLNWVFMDENFKITESGSNWRQVGDQTTEFSSLVSEIPVKVQKSGYVYVWVSNESNTPVYFDDLKINHRAGPLLQEDDYYPFGLEMKMLGSRAAGKQENKKKYNGIEFNNDFDIDTYEAFYRNLDVQIGRWWQIDPKCEGGINPNIEEDNEFGLESITPYNSMGNDPIRYSDPEGDLFGINNLIGAVIGAVVDYGSQVAINYMTNKPNPWTDNINLVQIGTATMAGLVTSGGTGVKALVKLGKAVVNNTVAVTTSNTGLKVKVETDAANIAKNTLFDLTTDNLGKNAASKASKQLSNNLGINSGTITKVVKKVVKSTGVKVTSKTNNAIKATSKAVVKQTEKTIENTIMVVVSPTKDKTKEQTNRQ